MNTVPLRPLQVKTVEAVHAKIRAGHKRVCCVAPTGFGKRYLAVWWAKECELQGKQAWIVTDRRTLVKQMRDELKRFGVHYGIIMSTEQRNSEAPIQVVSIHTARARNMLGDAEPHTINVGFVDEGHKEPEAYKMLYAKYPCVWIAFTATPVGPQGRSIIGNGLYDCMVEVVKNSELIAQGYLLPTKVIAPSAPDIKGVTINDGAEYNQSQLSRAVSKVTAFANVFDEWAPFADRQTILFAPGLAYCRGLQADFEHRGVPAALIEADTKLKDREEIFEKFANRDICVLLSVDILKEGFDAPIASCAIDLQPNSQLRTYWQKVGRIKRAHEGQSEAVYLDMAGNCWRHMLHPDDDPAWDEVTGNTTTAELYQRRLEEGKERAPTTCPKCKMLIKPGQRKCECGFEFKEFKPVKWIRMGDGKLKEVTAERIVKQEKSGRDKEMAEWKSCLFAALHSRNGLTFDQCRFIYQQRTGRYAPDYLPCMPVYGSAKRKMKVRDVYNPKDIMREFAK